MKALEGLTSEQLEHLRSLPGLIATAVTHSSVQPEYAEALSNLRSTLDRHNFWRYEIRNFYAVFPEAGRDGIAQHALKHNYAWILAVDADAAPFPHDSLFRLLRLAFIEMPHADMIGAYCQQKGHPYAPTIDTGTGRWEIHYPDSGILEVIRTGAHFFLLKVDALRRFGPPWFRSRQPLTPLRALSEFDGLCRRTLDGQNPFVSLPEYEKIVGAAKEDETKRLTGGTSDYGIVGEDSAFCDSLRASGGRIFVDTSIKVGHIDRKVIDAAALKEAMEGTEKKKRQTVGVDE